MSFKDLTLYIPDPGPLLEFFPPSLQFTVLVSYCCSNNKHRRSDFTQIYCITILEVSGLKCVSLGLNAGISRLFFLKAVEEGSFLTSGGLLIAISVPSCVDISSQSLPLSSWVFSLRLHIVFLCAHLCIQISCLLQGQSQ